MSQETFKVEARRDQKYIEGNLYKVEGLSGCKVVISIKGNNDCID